MDQSRYWIQKGRTCLNSHAFGDSWEEQAFAEDAAGPLGGCIWPPRSYTCSFCRREFRSAQALGGHMNVHRRDRAKLKQISSSSSNSNQILQSANTSFDRCVLQNPSEICNPNFDLDHALFSSSSPRPSTVSILRPFTCSFRQEQQKISTPLLSWSMLEPRKRFHIEDSGNQDTAGCATKVLESSSTSSKKNNHQIEVHLTGKLSSLVRKRCETPIFNDKEDAHDGLIFKKRRIDDGAHYFFPKNSNLVNSDEVEPVVPHERSPNSTLENLDLELRLGDRP